MDSGKLKDALSYYEKIMEKRKKQRQSAEPTADSNPQSEDMDLETLNSPAQNPMMATPPMEPTTTAIRTRSAAEKKMGKKRTMTGSGSSESGPVRLGPKEFASSVEMFDYFFNLLHFWPSQLNFNKVM
ncbi:hypothetical protein COLO4_32291 [Corchorus olitorius]|uniref:Uncharacterized protein n=1 Tax=Corchorus olitorius TaxID=93759 RepID=A0A1R3GZT6_9ROSI|nr:hypothetical protein COLO4_32291 [Corchorus olitorius]